MNVSIILSDITKVTADAIVNAANSSLCGGGGVDGAIHRSAGPELLKECIELRKKLPQGLPKGEAVATKAYNLNAKIIIHTVGPVYGINNITVLNNCYLNSLKLAEENNCKSIAFPAIGTGAHRVPIEISAKIVKNVLDNFHPSTLKEVMLVLFSKEELEVYNETFAH